MKKHQKRRGLLASAGVLLTAAALALSGAASAQAAPPEIPTSAEVKIRKTESPAVADAATGEQLTGDDLTALGAGINGVVFKATLVPTSGTSTAIDLATNAGQQDAGALSVLDAQARITAASPAMGAETFGATATDGPNGDGWTSKVLPRGVYLVEEVSVLPGVTPSAPFLLSVPMTDPTNRDQWLQTIYIYPKNDTFTTTKTVTEVLTDGADTTVSRTVGQNFEYTVLSDIPADRGLTSYTVVDSLNTNLVLVDGVDDVKVELVTSAGVPLTGAVQFAAGDYSVIDPLTVTILGDPAVGSNPATLGLAKLNAAPAGAQLRVTYTATVKADAGSVNVNNSVTTTATNAYGTSVSTDEVTIPFGDVNIVKTSSNTGNERLNGAEFRIYTDETAAKAGNTEFLTINGVSSWATNGAAPDAGLATISGLLYSNFVNGEITADNNLYRPYYLVEVKAPTGHQLLVEPVEVLVLGQGSVQATTSIQNVATTGAFVLPLTGGMGTAVLTIAGIAILAIVLLVVRRRRSAEAAE